MQCIQCGDWMVYLGVSERILTAYNLKVYDRIYVCNRCMVTATEKANGEADKNDQDES